MTTTDPSVHSLHNWPLSTLGYLNDLASWCNQAVGTHATAGHARRVATLLDRMLDRPLCRLAVYGTLAPGEMNHSVVAYLGGTWTPATIEGERSHAGGYPVFRWRPGGERVACQLLEADGLPGAWPRIDAFEGRAYRRILVPIIVGEHAVLAYVYESTLRWAP